MTPSRHVPALIALVSLLCAGLTLTLRGQANLAPAEILVPALAETATDLVSFDADGDGLPEIYAGFSDGLRAFAAPSLPTSSWVDVSASRLPSFNGSIHRILPFDFDADGDLDLAISTIAGEIRLFVNNGNGIFADQSALVLAAAPSLTGALSLQAAELDGDGGLDLIIWNDATTSATAPQILWSNGPGAFAILGQLPLPAGVALGRIDIDAVDLDGDLDLDLVVTSILDGSTFCAPFLNDGFGGLLLDPTLSPASFAAIAQTRGGPAFADLDGDKVTDMIVGGPTELRLARGLVGGGFAPVESGLPIPPLGGNLVASRELTLLDFDMDGDLDAALPALTSPSGLALAFSENQLDQSAGFDVPSLVPVGGSATLPFVFVDLDADGDLDLVEVGGDASIRGRENQGPLDTMDPSLLAITQLAPSYRAPRFATDAAPRVRARAQDAGGPLTLNLEIEATRDDEIATLIHPMTATGGDAFEAPLNAPALTGGLASTRLRYRIIADDATGNATTSAWRETRVTGKRIFGPTGGVHAIDLDLNGDPAVAESVVFEVSSTLAGAPSCLAVGAAGAPSSWFGGQVLFDLAGFVEFELLTEANGQATLATTIPPTLALERFVLQAFVIDSNQPFGVALSRGLDLTVGEAQSADILPVFPPSIASVSPSLPNPGELVTLSGGNFDQLATVLVNGLAVAATVVDQFTITFTMPLVPVDCASAVTVVNENGQTALTSIAPLPTVNHTVFGSGPATGGATFIIIGSGLGAGSTVMIDGNPAVVTSTSPTSVICLTPPGSPGPKPTEVMNGAGCSVTTTYTYF